jgi:hypothetical protein
MHFLKWVSRFNFFAIFVAAFVMIPVHTGAQTANKKTEVWMGGSNPLAAPKPGTSSTPRSDFFQMFDPAAPWQRTAKGIQVQELPPSLVLSADKATLSRIIADLGRRHIALAVEFGWLHSPNDDGRCGKGVEGFAHSGAASRFSRLIKEAGGDLQYVDMDEPLTFGHAYKGPQACKWTIEQTAANVAEGVAAIRAIFPNVQIGDTEPVGSADPTWPAQIRQWVAAYQAATGTPLAFLHADIQWNQPWQRELGLVKAIAHQNGLSFGIIYDGVGKTDVEWADGAVARFHQIEGNLQWKPDTAIIKSWEPLPTHMLPENQPGTLTNLALRYLEQER